MNAETVENPRPGARVKKTCAVWLVGWVALFGLYAWYLKPRFEWPGWLLGAGLGSVFAVVFLGSFSGLRHAAKDRSALARAEKGEAPRDGRLEAASGELFAEGTPLVAPFTRRECALYDYDVKPPAAGSRNAASEYAGLAMTPSVIRTPYGSVRLLGFPILDSFPKASAVLDEEEEDDADEHDGLEASDASEIPPASRLSSPPPPPVPSKRPTLAAARAYVEATPFAEGGIASLAAGLFEAVADDDGSVRKDWRIGAAPPTLVGRRVTERCVEPGTTVTAIGVFSAARGGLVAGDGWGGGLVRLCPGPLVAARAEFVGKQVKTSVMGFVFFLFSHGILGAMVYLSGTRHGRLSPSEQASTLRIAIQNHDAAALETAIRRGANPNAPDAFGDPVLLDTRDPEMIRTLAAGGADPNVRSRERRETPLHRAAREWGLAAAQALVAAKADVNAKDEDGVTPLLSAKMAGQADVVSFLESVGGTDDLVTASNGAEIPAEGGPITGLNAYLRALHAKNAAGMLAVWAGRKGVLENADLEIWARYRPTEPQLVDGYWAGAAATITIQGPTAGGTFAVWRYQLVEANGVWKVRREWSISG